MIDWTTIILALITGLPATIAALAALWKSDQTHKVVNSRMEEMLRLTRADATSKATLAEQSAEQMRKGDAAINAAKKDSA